MRIKIKSVFGPYYPMLLCFLTILLLLSLSRMGLLFVKPNRISSLQDVLQILFNGFRIDIVTAVYGMAIPTLLAPFFEGYRYTQKILDTLCIGMVRSFVFLPGFDGKCNTNLTSWNMMSDRTDSLSNI